MKKLSTLGLVIAMAAVLAACGGSNGDGGSATAASNGGSTVSVADIGDAGAVLVDSSGRALYASDQENTAGMVLCTGACNSFWKPLTAGGSAPKGGPLATHLGIVKRPDGSRQVTYDGKLLYTFTQEGPGEVTGNGFQDTFDGEQFTWHVVTAGNAGGSAGSSSSGSSGYGY